ncbi:MAG: GNAT family N-acetyltransferase [Chloroflexota bacterium]|nr:GNAT family N-acetyltransferase [Chloroflexota bacterium]
MEYLAFGEQHLDAVLHLTQQEGWPSFSADPRRALSVMTAPGVVAIVAVEHDAVVGFARVLHDGAITSYLAELIVAPAWRGQGIGRALIEDAFRRCGTIRKDLLADEESQEFYESLRHRSMPGYRMYPMSKNH